jgi:hypothetical protein
MPIDFSPGLDVHPLFVPSLAGGWLMLSPARLAETRVGSELREANDAWRAPIRDEDFTGFVDVQREETYTTSPTLLRQPEQERLVYAADAALRGSPATFEAKDGSFALRFCSAERDGVRRPGLVVTVRRRPRARELPAEVTHLLVLSDLVFRSLPLWLAAFLPGVDRSLLD